VIDTVLVKKLRKVPDVVYHQKEIVTPWGMQAPGANMMMTK